MRSILLTLTTALALVACGKESATTTTSSSPPTAATNPPSTAAATGATTQAATTTELTEGKPAPALKAKAHDGSSVDLAALKGKPVVVYFYPKDETPGCTKEACSFRDAWDRLSKTGVVLIGVSADSDESHKAFVAHHKLPFLLVSDEKGDIAKSFGVPMMGAMTSRQSFVIGADGNVKKIYRAVDVQKHADEIMKDLQSP